MSDTIGRRFYRGSLGMKDRTHGSAPTESRLIYTGVTLYHLYYQLLKVPFHYFVFSEDRTTETLPSELPFVRRYNTTVSSAGTSPVVTLPDSGGLSLVVVHSFRRTFV